MVDELWRWPYTPEIDRHGIARVPVPSEARSFLEINRKVELLLPDGTALSGHVQEFNKTAWVARVKVEAHE
jgi:hypothetical protein